jgi:hypothetical protein
MRKRFLALAEGFRQAWDLAVRDELAMACTEHIRSVDPRYLDHPAYDLAYTLEARRLLEARLKGAEGTGIVLDEALSAGIRRADSLFEGRRLRAPEEEPDESLTSGEFRMTHYDASPVVAPGHSA